MIIVVATHEEYKLAKSMYPKKKIIETGVGPINVIEKLRRIPKWIKILNIGYAGSNNLPIGTKVEIGYVMHFHPKTEYQEPAYITNDEEAQTWCYTSNEFIEEYNRKESCVFDMELAYIMALGFKRVKSIKIISDNLSMHEYEKSIKKEVLV